jgi:hypothetical protein
MHKFYKNGLQHHAKIYQRVFFEVKDDFLDDNEQLIVGNDRYTYSKSQCLNSKIKFKNNI